MGSSQFADSNSRPQYRATDWELVWEFEQDRWQHRLSILIAGEWQAVCQTCDFPGHSQPVYQDLFIEERPGNELEFQLMGQSNGTLHSAAVRCQPNSVSFDLAARFRVGAAPHPLAIRYRWEVPQAPPFPFDTVGTNSPLYAAIQQHREQREDGTFLTISIDGTTPASPPRNPLSTRPATCQWGYTFTRLRTSLPGI